MVTLDQLKIGNCAIVTAVNGEGSLRNHLLDMGITPHTKIMLRKVAPLGDPIEISLRGYELTIRIEDAKNIEIEEVCEDDNSSGR